VRVELRPTVPDDLPHIIGEPLPYRIRAITALVNGRVIGMGGIAFPPNGPVIAFVQQTEDARKYPVAFHRAGLMAMQMIRNSGVSEVVATAQRGSAVAVRWLERLGFRRADNQESDRKLLFTWNRAQPMPDDLPSDNDAPDREQWQCSTSPIIRGENTPRSCSIR
jgi:hypothetical protein